MTGVEQVIEAVLEAYPETQAIYLFGSWATEEERPDSDVDLAVLLPPALAKRIRSLAMSELQSRLQALLGRLVDLINLRGVSTVFQKEIIMAERRIFCANSCAADEFEMLVLSLYQKLNEERAEILDEGLRSGSFYRL